MKSLLIGVFVFRSEEDYGYVYDVYYTDGLGEESGVGFVYKSSEDKMFI